MTLDIRSRLRDSSNYSVLDDDGRARAEWDSKEHRRDSDMASCVHHSLLEHLDGLYSYAMSLARNESQAEDLVQETYLRATRAFGRLRPHSHIKSWLFTIMRHVFLNQIRHQYAGPLIVQIDDQACMALDVADKDAVDPLDWYLTKQRQRDVRSAVESLPDTFREVIVLREFRALSYERIAKILECPVGTVMSRLGRARDKLRKVLQHWDHNQDQTQIRRYLDDKASR